MGIQGLIQFLEKASSQVSLENIRGYTVAIDSYCWLHKGAFGCADQLSRGEDTDRYVQYCLKYVNLLLSYDIKPILVFDGRHLPAKALTEKRRRETRDQSKKRAAELLRLGQIEQARSFMRRCIDVTHEMAHRLMLECRKRNVDCIVAPYEADGQLAYLNIKNIAQYVITEDSDLVLFGCSKVIFKLDLNGKGVLVDAEKLPLAMGIKNDRYTFDKFRNMCILSGCDYLDSLPGIGLAKACKFFCRTEETDMRRALLKVPSYLNMKQLTVSEDYIESFLKANATFQHMFVFDPFRRKMVRLNEVPEDFDMSLCSNAGTICDNETAFQLALGNLNPFTLKRLDNWNPDRVSQGGTGVQSAGWSSKGGKAKHKSIWEPNFRVHEPGKKLEGSKESRCAIEFKRYALKDVSMTEEDPGEVQQSESEIMSFYAADEEPPLKRQCIEDDPEPSASTVSPLAATKSRNPFLKSSSHLASPTKLDSSSNSLLKNLSPRKVDRPQPSTSLSSSNPPRKLSSFNRTLINSETRVISRFFKINRPIDEKSTNENIKPEPKTPSVETTPEKSYNVAAAVAEIEKSEEEQRQEATALYLSSPEATLSDRGDQTPPRRDSLTSAPIDLACLREIDSGVDVSSNEKDLDHEDRENLPKELLDKFEFKVKPKEMKILEEDNIIEISDEETVRKVENTTKKVKPVVRRIGLSKPRTKKPPSVDASQSKLSKFFFKSKAALQ